MRWMCGAAQLGALALALCAPQLAQAAGFALNEQGASSAALGGAATARHDLAESYYYNPAALALGSKAAASVAVLSPALYNQASTGTTDTLGATSAVPSVGGGATFGGFGAGLSLGVPFGSGVTWPQGWQGRYDSMGSSLRVLELGAHGAYRPFKPLAIGASLRLQSLSFQTSRAIDVVRPGQDASVSITGDDSAISYGLSLLVMPIKPLTLGLSFRAGASHQAAGVADFKDVPIELEGRAHDTAASTGFELPGRLAIGAAYVLGDGTISADVEYWRWGVVRELVVDFEDESMDDVVQPRQWSDTFSARLGYEHQLLKGRLRPRAGLFYDPSPAPAATLGASSPDGDRVGASVGAGVALGFGLSANFSLGYTAILARQTQNPNAQQGQYGGRILSGVLGVAWTP